MPKKNKKDYRGITNYTLDVDGIRIPTIVPGNEALRGDVVLGNERAISDNEIIRALAHSITTGQFKPANQPISPLGSEFDMPSRMMEQPNLYHVLGKLYGGNYFANQIAYPEERNVGLLGRK